MINPEGLNYRITEFGALNSFDICLPARSRFGEGRDFKI
jgi:hypothetical protein